MIKAFRELSDIHLVLNAGERLLETQLGVSTCVSNCGLCCEQNVPQSMHIEALNMVSALLSVEASVNMAEGWLLEDHGLKVFRGVPTGVISGELKDEWVKMSKSKCPFLRDNKECQIYKERPITCRTFGIYRDCIADGFTCPRPPGKGETLSQRAIVGSDKVKPLYRSFITSCGKKNPLWVKHGFAPSLLFRAAKPDKFRAYIADNKIASAKLIGHDMELDLLWQNQLDALRRGVSPMKVILGELAGNPA